MSCRSDRNDQDTACIKTITIREPESHWENLEKIKGIKNFIDKQLRNALDWDLNVAGSVFNQIQPINRLIVHTLGVFNIDVLHRNCGIENDRLKSTGCINELVFDEAILKVKEWTFFISSFIFTISHEMSNIRISILKLDYLLIFLSTLNEKMSSTIKSWLVVEKLLP